MLFAGPRVITLLEDKYVSAYQQFYLSSSTSMFVRCQGFRTFPAALFSQIAHRRLPRRRKRASRKPLLHRLTKAAQRSLSLKLSACKLLECSLLRFQIESARRSGVVCSEFAYGPFAENASCTEPASLSCLEGTSRTSPRRGKWMC